MDNYFSCINFINSLFFYIFKNKSYSIDNKNKIDNASNKMKDELKQYMASLINTNKVNKEKNIEFENINSNKSFDNSYSSY